MPFEDSAQPLVSVICFCKDRASLIKRCIESVVNQTYRNLEFVVQDGASTDGTLELLQSYAERDPRIKIVSEPDSGPAEAYWKVLHRCTGDYIATCLSDEELALDAVEKAVSWFAAAPTVGAFTCDGHTTDADGKIIGEFKAGEFDFAAYLFGRYCPFWPGSFFRRSALLDIGLQRPGWNLGCLEFEIWCRLAQDHEVRYVPEPMSKYAIHPGQLSNTPQNFHEHIDNRLALIERMFSVDGFFGAGKLWEQQSEIDLNWAVLRDHWFREAEAKINQLEQFEFHARAHELRDEEKGFNDRSRAVKEAVIGYHEHNVTVLRAKGGSPELSDRARRERTLHYIWQAWQSVVGVPPRATVRNRMLRFKLAAQRILTDQLLARLSHPVRRSIRLAEWLGLDERACPEFREFAERQRAMRWAQLYDTIARIYEGRGQIEQALFYWRRAEPLESATAGSFACQTSLKAPDATYQSLAEMQQRWVDRHIKTDDSLPSPTFSGYDGKRKIRVGYHCSFMDADTIRYIMRRTILAHDRSKFDVIGYAPMKLPEDLQPAFQTARMTAGMSDRQFLELVRQDGIDVFVELSGFSPGHRFGAMANRCAPVQISYLNHFSTSRVPNVDYILSDATCTPLGSDAQRSFSERIHLLPRCLLCYDYTDDGDSPAISDPPSSKTGFVTFGCFGSGGKINLRTIEIWCNTMRQVPRSRILIQNSQLDLPDNRRFMTDRFARFGISPERVLLRPGVRRSVILEAYREIDIWPYCGGNTIAESLWQGVPVVTLKGARFSSRYGASLLIAAGCPDLVAGTPEEYCRIAASLAGNPDRLTSLRHSLRSIYTKSGLNDSTRFARELEGAYSEMMMTWQKERTGVVPASERVLSER
jgi:predicted O-linked N-acetylglucosamine transferase (SPINDLY family)/glycosyltransferase involved in cell wall biosynthesis